MTTPIFDYLENYKKSNPVRLHMPGHKGINSRLDIEDIDLTEIVGADDLYSPEGIIAESEKNAGDLFGADSFYSTEGSSHSIRAMLFLFVKWSLRRGEKPLILAGRNVHKTFINAVALMNIETEWLMGSEDDSYEVCSITATDIEDKLASMKEKPGAVYITSPDYLGNITDVESLARVCHEKGILLLVDNAHGAYLKFLTPSRHPMDLGADICADSAHKTLPVITGGAYLHISKKADPFFKENAKLAMEMFGSTSPSYLIMASLDLANPYLEALPDKLAEFLPKVDAAKKKLSSMGYTLSGDEPTKITIKCAGKEIADKLMASNIFIEYFDDAHLVFMLTPENKDEDLDRLLEVMGKVEEDLRKPRPEIKRVSNPVKILSPAAAIYSDFEELPSEKAVGRVLASAAVSCPPAVPIYMLGERIEKDIFPGKKVLVVKNEPHP